MGGPSRPTLTSNTRPSVARRRPPLDDDGSPSGETNFAEFSRNLENDRNNNQNESKEEIEKTRKSETRDESDSVRGDSWGERSSSSREGGGRSARETSREARRPPPRLTNLCYSYF